MVCQLISPHKSDQTLDGWQAVHLQKNKPAILAALIIPALIPQFTIELGEAITQRVLHATCPLVCAKAIFEEIKIVIESLVDFGKVEDFDLFIFLGRPTSPCLLQLLSSSRHLLSSLLNLIRLYLYLFQTSKKWYFDNAQKKRLIFNSSKVNEAFYNCFQFS